MPIQIIPRCFPTVSRKIIFWNHNERLLLKEPVKTKQIGKVERKNGKLELHEKIMKLFTFKDGFSFFFLRLIFSTFAPNQRGRNILIHIIPTLLNGEI